MVSGPAVWGVAALVVLVVGGASAVTYVVCRRMLAREIADLRRLLAEPAPTAGAAAHVITLHAEAAPQERAPVACATAVKVRIRKRTPGTVLAEDAAVIAAAALSAARATGTLDISAVAASPLVGPRSSNWVQQGRVLVHAARNVQYRSSPQAPLSLVRRGNGEAKSEAAD